MRRLMPAVLLLLASAPLAAQEPRWLRDRGPGVATSMFGSRIERGTLLVYPFFEYYHDDDFEYKPSEFGFPDNVDYRGRYRAREGLLFLGYGLGDDLAIELEAAVISARLERAANDPSAMPAAIEEAGLGDVEGQLRWRMRRETATRPELFGYFETVFPLQKNRQLIGTSDWEWKAGLGVTRGFGFGTMTFRAAVEYGREEGKFDAGEYAIEYLRRLSPRFSVYAGIEGNQLDEVVLIQELQWRPHPRVTVKLNNALGVTPNATGWAPEVGVMFRL